jgi:hypothetical protein
MLLQKNSEGRLYVLVPIDPTTGRRLVLHSSATGFHPALGIFALSSRGFELGGGYVAEKEDG